MLKVIFYKKTSLVSRIIQWFTRSNFDHCSVLINDYKIIEALPIRGVIISDPKDLPNNVTFSSFKCSAKQEAKIIEFLTRQVGKKYDFWAIFQFILRNATRKSRKASNKWICSELVFCSLEKANIFALKEIEPWKVSPRDLSISPIFTNETR